MKRLFFIFFLPLALVSFGTVPSSGSGPCGGCDCEYYDEYTVYESGSDYAPRAAYAPAAPAYGYAPSGAYAPSSPGYGYAPSQAYPLHLEVEFDDYDDGYYSHSGYSRNAYHDGFRDSRRDRYGRDHRFGRDYRHGRDQGIHRDSRRDHHRMGHDRRDHRMYRGSRDGSHHRMGNNRQGRSDHRAYRGSRNESGHRTGYSGRSDRQNRRH